MEYLPIFIPLTLLNLYIRTVAETIYKDLGATGDFEKCPSCKSTIFFEEPGNENKTQNRSCPCGYSWCRDCKGVPHWPMNCENYAEWEKKWLVRYTMINAQGTGTETLLQITCSCKTFYSVKLPNKFASCPGCKININAETMNCVYYPYYYPYPARYREQQRSYDQSLKYADNGPYCPVATVYTDIRLIPAIKDSVMRICARTRDLRLDIKLRNRFLKAEQLLIKNGILKTEILENLLGTALYLVENVTAWMHMTNRKDKSLKDLLEEIMVHREKLLELLELESHDALRNSVQQLRKAIDSVVASVDDKIEQLIN